MSQRELGRYHLTEAIGHGGMAAVYRAWDDELKRWVAIKELRLPLSPDPTLALRFLREARTAAALNHPNIVTVYEHVVFDDTPYISMELLRRGSLQPYLNRTSLAQFMGVMRGVLRGLAHAASQGVVHRDLKPANLLVTDDGSVKIADFGIAKARTATADVFATVTGTTSGTPQYMAPEQALARDIGPHTDLYSVGIIAYEMLVGRTPFSETREPIAIAKHHLDTPIAPAASVRAEIEPDLSDWIGRLLTKDWRERPDDAEAVWFELEEIALAQLGPTWHREAALPLLAPLPVLAPPTPQPRAAADASTPVAEPVVVEDLPVARPEPVAPEPVAPPPPAVPPRAVAIDDSIVEGFATFAPQGREEAKPSEAAVEPVVEPDPVAPSTPAESPAAIGEDLADDLVEVAEEPPAATPAEPEPEPELEVVDDAPDESTGWRTAVGSTLRGRGRAPADPPTAPDAPEPVAVEPEPEAVEDDDATAAPMRVVPPPARTPTPAAAVAPPRPAAATTAPTTSPEIRRRRLVAVGAVVAAVLAAGAGYALGHGSPAADPAAAQLPATAVGSDGVALQVPASWEPAAAPALGKVGEATMTKASAAGPGGNADQGIIAATLAGEFGDDLLPAGTRSGGSTAVTLGEGVQALRHADADLGALGKGTAFAVAAGDGVGLLLCHTSVPPATCEALATTFRLPGSTVYPLTPDAATAKALTTVLGRLSREASAPRAELASATTRAGQSRSARRAAAPYDTAAERLRALPTTARTASALGALTGATDGVGARLRDLASAADAGSSARYEAARKALAERQGALAKAAERLRALGYGVRSAR